MFLEVSHGYVPCCCVVLDVGEVLCFCTAIVYHDRVGGIACVLSKECPEGVTQSHVFGSSTLVSYEVRVFGAVGVHGCCYRVFARFLYVVWNENDDKHLMMECEFALLWYDAT